MNDASDIELLSRWRDGNSAAGSKLVERHFSTVYRFFRRKLEDAELAKELSQKTFLTCMEARDRLREASRFRAFLLGIARNLLLRHFRAAGKAAEREAATPVDPAVTPTSPSRVVAMQEEQELLLRALRRLPLDLQITLELHYWEQMTTAEIGDVLEVQQGTVKWRLSRARDLLREEIEKISTSAALVQSTVGDLDRWARSLRNLVDEE